MAVRLFDKPAFATVGSDANGPTYASRWGITGTTDIAAAKAVLLAGTPSIVATAEGMLYRQPHPQITQVTYDSYECEVQYTARKKEEWTWDFDTTGGTVHISHSKATTSYGTSPPDHKQLIGVDRTGEPKGTDIVIPAMKVNVSYKHPLGTITLAYAKLMHDNTGKVNSAPFLGFAAGEVLFLGARGSDGTQTEATVSYSFAMSANATGLTIGAISNIAKKGWEYLWITYKDAVSNNKRASQPEFVYVERVYDTVDLGSVLGFG
jgi:hypothetical protein